MGVVRDVCHKGLEKVEEARKLVENRRNRWTTDKTSKESPQLPENHHPSPVT
jgi:hypothetical protein